jgi:ribosomal protein S24E
MEIQTISDKKNPFLKRRELRLKLIHLGATTPSKVDLTKEIVSKFNAYEDQVSIDYIFSTKGIGESIAKVKIFDDKKVKKVEDAKDKAEGVKDETQTDKSTPNV